MKNTAIEQELESLPDLGCEGEDIAHAMRDESEFSRNWINDCILTRHIKKTGNDRLSAKTRKLIKIKSYTTYISLSKKLCNDLQKQMKKLLSEI